MHLNFTKLLSLFLFLFCFQQLQAQTIITQWNFNSVPPDGMTGTGTALPSFGAGTVSLVGGTTATFANGAGSSDPAAADNSGYNTTTYPAQGAGNKTRGIQVDVSTVGYTNIMFSFDLRHSSTSARHIQVQYTADRTAGTPVWIDALPLFEAASGDAWFNNRTIDFSSIASLNNNPNVAFRVVSAFAPTTSTYAAANSGSTYAGGGTWRFDMVTVTGTSTGTGDVTAPVALTFQPTSNTTSFIKFSEPVTSTTVSSLSNYVFNPSITIISASISASGDTVYLSHAPLADGQPYTMTIANIQDAAGNSMSSTNFDVLFNGSLPNLVITEIIHSPNDVEMIEVYNAGTTAISLGGLRWTDGTTGAFPVVSLAAGATAVFATATGSASATLNVSPVYPILNGLGSSNDILVIRNSLNQVVDSVDYYVGTNGWPAAPTGLYAYSFELNSASNDNNVGANWFVPLNPVVPQPAGGAIRATPGVYPTPPYTPLTASLSFVGTSVNVTEATTTVNIIANLQGGGASMTTVDLEIVPVSTATAGADFTLPASLQFSWAPFTTIANDTIVITINNDVLPENAEYITVRLANPVNTSLPAPSSNYFTVYIQDNDKTAPTALQTVTLNHIASFSNGASGANSAEIVAHDPVSQRLFIANSVGKKLDIVDFKNPANATLIASIPVSTWGNINSVAVKNSIVALAIEDNVPELPGKVVFLDTTGAFLNQVTVGAMPDMIVFNNAGTRVMTANEGQPSSDYTNDPEGSVSIIDISGGILSLTQANVATAGFSSFNGDIATLRNAGVRIFGLNSPTVAQDMEPEYITISADDSKAWVTCQENNAIAEIDLATKTVVAIRPLGTKDHSITKNALDASDQGGVIQIANWPVKGLYMPDAIASYEVGGQTYLVTANEGDAREYGAYEEATRLSSSTYVLDATAFPYGAWLKAQIGRLNVTKASGDLDGDGDFDEIHAFGSRSFSIWNATTGQLVWDSGDELEEITSKHPVFGALFNASNSNNSFKNRSDDKGPEPEGVAVTTINGRVYAFIALERIGGCMVYDITNPAAPVYVDYKNTRNVAAFGGDNGAEGIIYIPANLSPNGSPIVILANEVSSTLSFFSVNNAVLDIALQDIKAVNVGNRNQVEWVTADEQQGDVFELQRSKDGSRFQTIATLPAKGIPSSYNYWDEKPLNGVNYYRLKLNHLSGGATYSKIVSASLQTKPRMVAIYPNPAQSVLTVKLEGSASSNALVEIVNASGQVVLQQKLANLVQQINIATLPAGVYTLRYTDGQKRETVPFIKQ